MDYFHKKIIGFEKLEQDNQSIAQIVHNSIVDIKGLLENQDNLLELSQMASLKLEDSDVMNSKSSIEIKELREEFK